MDAGELEMNKRHLAIFISIGLLIGIAVLVLMIRTGGARDIALLLANGDKPAVSEHIKPSKTKDWMSEPARASEKPSLTAMKPKSIKMGEGATAVVEIDHGLQAVDLTKGDKYSAAVDKACDKGAMGAVSFLVVDDRGQPVPGATVKASFSNRRQAGHDFEKTTDENGLVALQDTCVGDLNFRILKDGHYDTRLRYWFFKAWFDCVKDGRWIPWNPTIEVMLKRVVNPAAMYAVKNRNILFIPETNKVIGFDMMVNDWTMPHGKGATEDFAINFNWNGKTGIDYEGAELSLVFNQQFSGAYIVPQDEFSAYRSPYFADTNRIFLQRFDWFTKKVNEKWEKNFLDEHSIMVLRIRSRIDQDGKLVGGHYAKIYAPLRFTFGNAGTGELRLWYIFNPVENDLNLEFDISKNLLSPLDYVGNLHP